jgi:serine/threonine-protein kinase
MPAIPGYVLLAEIGRGGMGVVYRARSEADGTLVAVKIVPPAVKPSERDLQRFLREAAILRELTHPHIVAFRDLGETHGLLYFAMDFVDGSDAARMLKDHGPLPVPRAVGIICQLLDALAFAHSRGFVHRDIKPANLLLESAGGRETLKLADFGLARTYQASQLSGLTMAGSVGGTALFMPPEQVLNFREVKPAADQFAAVASLYNLLTKQYLYDFKSGNVQELLKQVLLNDPVPIRTRCPDLPPGLVEVINKGLARKPELRYPDVAALRKALMPFAASH